MIFWVELAQGGSVTMPVPHMLDSMQCKTFRGDVDIYVGLVGIPMYVYSTSYGPLNR